MTKIDVPASVTKIGDGAFMDCGALSEIRVSAGNTAYQSIDGNLYSKDGKTLIQYAIGKTDGAFTLPSGVEKIAAYAFYDCGNLTSVVLGDGVTSVGDYAFQYCGKLESGVLGKDVTSVGESAFGFCLRLTSATFADATGWHRTDSWLNWTDKTDGVAMDVADAAETAKNLAKTYSSAYWYKK